MSVLVVADASEGFFSGDSVARVIAAVRKLGEVHVLLVGATAGSAAPEAARFEGVSKVLVADQPLYLHGMAEPASALVVELSDTYSHICGAGTSFGKSILPRVAALLDVMVISDVISIIDAETFERPVYAGSAIQTVDASSNAKKVFTVRTAGFSPVDIASVGGPVADVVAPGTECKTAVWLEDALAASGRPPLSSARIVVSGGRGVGSEANFALIEQLADKMGGAVGASRAAVDSGFASNDLQVGQTGKIIAPELYVAVGISGAIQHLAGMKDSRIIVAVNNDPDAPIFQVADYGLVADLFEAVPAMISKL